MQNWVTSTKHIDSDLILKRARADDALQSKVIFLNTVNMHENSVTKKNKVTVIFKTRRFDNIDSAIIKQCKQGSAKLKN